MPISTVRGYNWADTGPGTGSGTITGLEGVYPACTLGMIAGELGLNDFFNCCKCNNEHGRLNGIGFEALHICGNVPIKSDVDPKSVAPSSTSQLCASLRSPMSSKRELLCVPSLPN